MALQNPTDFPSEDIVYLDRGEGTSVLVHLFGGTLLSWKCKGIENIFLSSKAVFDKKKAIRGGVPLVFPNFGPWKLGPQHGFARIKQWGVEQQPKKDANGNVSAVLTLIDDEETRAMWNHRFKLTYTLVLGEDSLTFKLGVQNNNDQDTFDFTCLFHTYFRVSDIAKTGVTGLNGLVFCDKLQDDKEEKETRDEIYMDKNYDRVYKDVPGIVKISSCPEPNRKIEVSLSNLPDVVLWNPWDEKAKAMADFDDLGYHHMICVEGGSLSSRNNLPAGKHFECQQVFKSML